MLFDKVLIANRGEIAVRLIRACRKMGYRTVAVYSEADANAVHVELADQALCIGAAAASESYLSIAKIIAAAKTSGASAIHPGYGFLSERSDFAQAVQQAGLIFIGPDPESIAAMGNKSTAKIRMQAAGVPCIPGYQDEDQNDATLIGAAKHIGYPVMIKAAAGGGGRGMRLVEREQDLPEQIQSARSEAVHAFGNGQLLLEKALLNARHVEIQIFGDRHGNVVHFGERDCSVQRRNQKVVEEAPSPAVTEALRLQMGAAAVAAARSVNYVGAGTVEFMLDSGGEFYFLEMNTRLQVEHPVTELVYDVDLVEWQLRVAQGETLPWTQEQILQRRNGWAIEVRLCTEDPAQGFLPQTGTLLSWKAPSGRIDHALQEGAVISPYYDSMQAKLIAHGTTRDEARRRLVQMLDDTVLLGVASNRDFLRRLIGHSQFADGRFSTSFINDYFPGDAISKMVQPDLCHLALAGALFYRESAQSLSRSCGIDPQLLQWQSSAPASVTLKLQAGEQGLVLNVTPLNDTRYLVELAQGKAEIELTHCSERSVRYEFDGVTGQANKVTVDRVLWLECNGQTRCYEDQTFLAADKMQQGADGRLTAPMDGKMMALLVRPGDRVSKGQKLAVLEAMKMEFSITGSIDGVVESVHCQSGLQVKLRQLLIVLKPAETEKAV